LPASFLLVGSANPCPCGWRGSQLRECTCGPYAVERYRSRLSGPLLDRIDLHVFVPPVALVDLRAESAGESSAAIRDRVTAARDRQRHRLRRWSLHCNAETAGRSFRDTCRLDAAGEILLDQITHRRGITGRAVDRMIKVARTIADLAGRDAIDPDDLRHAAGFRTVHRDDDLEIDLSQVPRRKTG
jgi:magnesium chelatase family protein